MTEIQKLSDRDGMIFEAIRLITINLGPMPITKLQWELFRCGVYIKMSTLTQAISVMREKGTITRTPVKDAKELVTEEPKAGV